MNLNQLKIELLQKIIECEDEQILLNVKELLDQNVFRVADSAEGYVKKNHQASPVPNAVYKEMDEDYKKFKKGELETKSWEEVKSVLQNQDGI